MSSSPSVHSPSPVKTPAQIYQEGATLQVGSKSRTVTWQVERNTDVLVKECKGPQGTPSAYNISFTPPLIATGLDNLQHYRNSWIPYLGSVPITWQVHSLIRNGSDCCVAYKSYEIGWLGYPKIGTELQTLSVHGSYLPKELFMRPWNALPNALTAFEPDAIVTAHGGGRWEGSADGSEGVATNVTLCKKRQSTILKEIVDKVARSQDHAACPITYTMRGLAEAAEKIIEQLLAQGFLAAAQKVTEYDNVKTGAFSVTFNLTRNSMPLDDAHARQ